MKPGQQGMIHEDRAASGQTKRWFYGDKAMGNRGILDVFISIFVFCFICLFVIGILYIVAACILKQVFQSKNQKSVFVH